MIKSYMCETCHNEFDFHHHPSDEVAVCPKCDSNVLQRVINGGAVFKVIVPDYPGAKRLKAGHIHRFQNRPAETSYVTVPSTILK